MNKIKISQFIGRQLSRLKAGQSYFMMFMTMLIAVGVLKTALPKINFSWLIGLCFVALTGAFVLGLTMDKSSIITMDYYKSVEMTQRYLTVLDEKNNDFRMLQMKVMGEWIKALQENRPVNTDILDEEYKKFKKKYSPPEEK